MSAYDNLICKVIYICRDCYNSLANYTSIQCDNCYQIVTPENGLCPFCHFDFSELDIMKNIYKVLGE